MTFNPSKELKVAFNKIASTDLQFLYYMRTQIIKKRVVSNIVIRHDFPAYKINEILRVANRLIKSPILKRFKYCPYCKTAYDNRYHMPLVCENKKCNRDLVPEEIRPKLKGHYPQFFIKFNRSYREHFDNFIRYNVEYIKLLK